MDSQSVEIRRRRISMYLGPSIMFRITSAEIPINEEELVLMFQITSNEVEILINEEEIQITTLDFTNEIDMIIMVLLANKDIVRLRGKVKVKMKGKFGV